MLTKQNQQRSGDPLLLFDFEGRENRPGASDHAVGGLDDLLRGAVRPPGDVGEAFAAGVDAGAGEDEKRDALSFDVGTAPTAGREFAPIVRSAWACVLAAACGGSSGRRIRRQVS